MRVETGLHPCIQSRYRIEEYMTCFLGFEAKNGLPGIFIKRPERKSAVVGWLHRPYKNSTLDYVFIRMDFQP